VIADDDLQRFVELIGDVPQQREHRGHDGAIVFLASCGSSSIGRFSG
jgi:hypothetical protein